MSIRVSSRSKHFVIPLELIEFAVNNHYIKALMVYLYLKMKCDGVLNKTHINIEEIKSILGISTKRTFQKQIDILLRLNWIGYNDETKNFFIRSFKRIRKTMGLLKRTAVVFEHSHFTKFKNFTQASIICDNVKRQEFAFKKAAIKRIGKTALQKGDALQILHSEKGFLPYFGKSNRGIGKLLGCSQSEANRVKMLAEDNGFLTTHKKYHLLSVDNFLDYRIKAYSKHPNKIRFEKSYHGDELIYNTYQQLHDEIVSNLRFRRIGKIY